MILNKKGEILLAKRIEPMFPWNGKWGIPGGHLEFGETPRQTLYREMAEELKVEIELLKNTPFIACRTLNFKKITYHGIFLCYLCRIIKGSPRRKSDEHSDLRWFKQEKIDFKNCIPMTEDFIRQLRLDIVSRQLDKTRLNML